MQQQLILFVHDIRGLSISLAVVAATVACGYILRKALIGKVVRWASGTTTQIDDIVIGSVKGPFIIWFLILGLYLGLELSSYPERVVSVVQTTLVVLGILSVTFVASGLTSRIIRSYGSRIDAAVPVTSLTQHVSRIVIFAIGLLIILNTLGITITPILATLGVGGLAVALALQDTLANLFAGFHIIAAKQVRIGDYVKIESGEEGYVTDINWRTTKIRMLANNTVLVPNATIAKAIVTNYHLPEEPMSVLVGVGVHYGSDLRKVQRVACEVGSAVMQEVPGGVPDFEPFIRYHRFGESSIDFNVILRVKEFADQHVVRHEFIVRLHERFAREGIVIPFPIRAINYDQERSR